MQNYYYIRVFQHILRKTSETCNIVVMRITHAMNGSTEGPFWFHTFNWTFVLRCH